MGLFCKHGTLGPGSRAHYAEDIGYWQTKGFYEVLDWLYANVPNFAYENCADGGNIKDYGIMKRTVKVQPTDHGMPQQARCVFWDSSYALHPDADLRHGSGIAIPADRRRALPFMSFVRRCSAEAGFVLTRPTPQNGGPKWSESRKLLLKQAVETYKTKLRPLVRTANLYHILPRPDDSVWDGIEYFDPAGKKGAICVFRPNNPNSMQTVKMKGLEARRSIGCGAKTVRSRRIRLAAKN